MFGLIFLIIILLLIFLLFSGGYNKLAAKCVGDDIISCVLDDFLGGSDEKKEEAPKNAVTATGVVSNDKGTVTFTLTFPREGGTVTGSFSGDCDGNIKGTYAGNGGSISGEGKGSCSFVFPASGNFSGSVNEASKTVNLSGNAKISGFGGEGSLTLTY